MQLPPPTAHYRHVVRYGRYVERRLRRAKRNALADAAEQATRKVRETGRASEDADDPVQDALADRDAADDTLDTIAQDARVQLAGRSADAARKPPYIRIFPDGVGYYTAVPVSEETKRYSELKQRIEEHLPADDPVRIAAVPAIAAGLDVWGKALHDLETAQTQSGLAGTRYDVARDEWDRQMERIYGVLVAEESKQRAERHFPRFARRSRDENDVEE